MRLAGWGADLLELLLPAGCVACRAWIPGGARAPLVCDRCRSRLRPAPWPRCPRCHHPRGGGRPPAPDCLECRGWPPELTAARHAFVLEAPAADLVHALKYEGWPELATLMGDALARLEPPGPRDGKTVVVPVPTTPGRLRSRGYNQAELLAMRVAEVRGLPLERALARTVEGRSQTSLDPAERRENVRGAFAPVPGGKGAVAGARVLLVDDVLTTGATAAEAAVALAEVGARDIVLMTFARALPGAPRSGR